MTYGSLAGVEGINAHMQDGYTPESTPSMGQVVTFLADGAAALDAELAKAGYVTPIVDTVACYRVIARLNNLFAAASAEEAVNLTSAGDGGETRSQRLWAMYLRDLAAFLGGDLTTVGLTRTTTAPVRRSVRSLSMQRRDGYSTGYTDEYNSGTRYKNEY
jgi:hypothetical protein